jgi:type IV pilus assembly protein PilY1
MPQGGVVPPLPPNSFVDDLVAFDRDLDFRTDIIFGGKAITGAPWEGKLFRLTTGCWSASSPVCQTDPNLWGVPSGAVAPAPTRAPSEILYQFKDGSGATATLGPVTSGVGVTIDQTGNTWVFAGTGRYFTQTSGTGDKIDTSAQYLVGIKDPVMAGSSGCTDTTIAGCRVSSTASNELIDMSTATVCKLGTGTCDGTTTQQVTSVPALPSGGTYASLLALVQSKTGWFNKLAVPAGGLPSERVVSSPTLDRGIVFFPTFTPSGDVCVAAGSSNLFGLYYLTGGAYSSPVMGMTGQNINKSGSFGEGLATSVTVFLDQLAISQSSTGAVNTMVVTPPPGTATGYVSWINQKD